MSGEEFDVPALVRVFNNTDLGVVRSAIVAAGLSEDPSARAAGAVLEELDDEIRLLSRYRTTQENSAQAILEELSVIVENVRGIGRFLTESFTDPIGFANNIRRTVSRMFLSVDRIKDSLQTNNRASRLAKMKLEELKETRGKIALILL